MLGDLERLPAPGASAVLAAGPAVLAAELLGRMRAELPGDRRAGERDQVLVSAWLTGLRSARTRRAYAGDGDREKPWELPVSRMSWPGKAASSRTY